MLVTNPRTDGQMEATEMYIKVCLEILAMDTNIRHVYHACFKIKLVDTVTKNVFFLGRCFSVNHNESKNLFFNSSEYIKMNTWHFKVFSFFFSIYISWDEFIPYYWTDKFQRQMNINTNPVKINFYNLPAISHNCSRTTVLESQSMDFNAKSTPMVAR